MSNLLLDTGPFVALLDKSEKNHKRCVHYFESFKGKIITTEPVLTETIYLLGPSVKRQRVAIEFILKGGAALAPQSNHSLSRAIALMEKYRDIPMDFADATLVCLAEDLGTNEIFTLDIRGFSAYRLQEKKVFTIFPE
jgi:uncharacterized protein